jgi:hypothetical protein
MRGKKCAVRRAQCAEKAADKGVTFEEAGCIAGDVAGKEHGASDRKPGMIHLLDFFIFGLAVGMFVVPRLDKKDSFFNDYR